MIQHFSKILHLAYRNLFRNKRRTLFAIFIAASGYAAMAIALGYYGFSIYGLQEMTIRNGFGGSGGTGHLQIKDNRSLESQEKYTLEFGLADYQKMIKTIKNQPEVDYVLPRIEFGGLVTTGDKSFPFIGYGVESMHEAALRGGLSDINPSLKLGEEIKPLDKNKFGIILGKKLANALGVKIGDPLMLYGATVQGAVNAIDVELVGVMSTGLNETDKYYLLTHIDLVQRLVNTDKISLISVMFKNRDSLDYKLSKVQSILASSKGPGNNETIGVITWETLAEYYTAAKDLFNMIFSFMGIIILTIVILSCWNIMNMTTMERIREIGTLRAIGLKNTNITFIFLLEAFLISIIGLLIGIIAQVILSNIINALNIEMPPVPGMNQGYALQVYTLSPYHLFIAIAVVLAITLSSLSAFFIIRKLTIVESLEHA
ncbi:MAG: FtsX-like permease family protein [Sporocytophaga sp.]|nr:FtsX-like permease family protein [Sporocytophaga sp.]